MNEYSSYLSSRGYSHHAICAYFKRRRQSRSVRLALDTMRNADSEWRAYAIAKDRADSIALGTAVAA